MYVSPNETVLSNGRLLTLFQIQNSSMASWWWIESYVLLDFFQVSFLILSCVKKLGLELAFSASSSIQYLMNFQLI